MSFSANDISALDWVGDREWLFLRRLQELVGSSKKPVMLAPTLFGFVATFFDRYWSEKIYYGYTCFDPQWAAIEPALGLAADLLGRLCDLGAIYFTGFDGFPSTMQIHLHEKDFPGLLTAVERARAS